MSRLCSLVVLALAVAILSLLPIITLPLSTGGSSPASAPPVLPHTEMPPASAAVRDFTVYAPVGRAALDRRAEVLFDN